MLPIPSPRNIASPMAILPDVLQLPPINGFGNVMEIAELFGGADQLRNVVNEIQAGLYAA
jgi:type I restriction enzyme, R subunit